jgi:hypothetical protein
MPYRVFETDDEGANELNEDDLVSRQNITEKNGDRWDVDGTVVLVEGNEEALDHAEEIVEEHGGRVSPDGEQIKADIDAEEDNAAAGVGAVFG